MYVYCREWQQVNTSPLPSVLWLRRMCQRFGRIVQVCGHFNDVITEISGWLQRHLHPHLNQHIRSSHTDHTHTHRPHTTIPIIKAFYQVYLAITWIKAMHKQVQIFITHSIFHLRHIGNKMQSATADFAPGAATWRTGRNIHVVFDSCPFAPLCENMT